MGKTETTSDSETMTPFANDGRSDVTTYRDPEAYIVDTKDQYTLSFDIPGVKMQDVRMQVQDSVVYVTAERKSGDRTVTKFVQQFRLDDDKVDVEKMSASLADGVLTIQAPKKAESAPICVPITASEPTHIDEAGLSLTIDVPGVKKGDLSVDFHKGCLHIRGERIQMSAQGKRRVVAKINRFFQIKEKLADVSKLNAFLCDGVLTIVAPARLQQESKAVKILTLPAVNEESPVSHVHKEEKEEIVVETVAPEDEQ